MSASHIRAEIAERVRVSMEGTFTDEATDHIAENILQLCLYETLQVAPHAFVHRDEFIKALQEMKRNLPPHRIIDIADIMAVYDELVVGSQLDV